MTKGAGVFVSRVPRDKGDGVRWARGAGLGTDRDARDWAPDRDARGWARIVMRGPRGVASGGNAGKGSLRLVSADA